MVVYKIVTREGDKLFSSTAEGPARVMYKPHRFVEAPEWCQRLGYHLTVFRAMPKALLFTFEDHEVWVAWAMGISEPLQARRPKGYVRPMYLDEPFGQWSWPSHTLFARRVKLLHRINESGERYRVFRVFKGTGAW
jgi:hypothetical protein